jgi:hypothetical protein
VKETLMPKRGQDTRPRKTNIRHTAQKSDHAYVGTPTYRSWRAMKTWCLNKNHEHHEFYASVGMCDRWMDFLPFLEDMGERPSPDHTLDRIDGSKGYSKENCRWATRKEQTHNRSSNVFLEWSGERLVLSEWARRIGVHKKVIMNRIKKGWNTEQILTTKKRKWTKRSALAVPPHDLSHAHE